MTEKEIEWLFSFGLMAKEDGAAVPESEAKALWDTIIEDAESRGLVVTGGPRPGSWEIGQQ